MTRWLIYSGVLAVAILFLLLIMDVENGFSWILGVALVWVVVGAAAVAVLLTPRYRRQPQRRVRRRHSSTPSHDRRPAIRAAEPLRIPGPSREQR